MKCTYLPFLFIIYLSFLSSCKKDFLDVPDGSVVLRQHYVVDLKTTGEYLNGIYVKLGSEFYHGYNCVYPELIADNIKPITNPSALSSHYNWAQIAGTPGLNMDNFWLQGYQIIRSCSFVLEKAEEYGIENPAKSDHLKAQAYALRAFVHFKLLNVFAQAYSYTIDASHPGIPYVVTPEWSEPAIRQPVSTVYENMISDLTNALPLFDSDAVNTLYMNKIAAKALLARIALFKTDHRIAKDLSLEVLNHVPIMTGPNYPSKLFTLEETEALFQLPPSWPGVSNATYTTFFPAVYFNQPLYEFCATNDIALILKEDVQDIRNNWVTEQPSGDWNITKFPADVETGFPVGSLSYYQTLLRSSEMCLTASESYVHLNQEDSARFYLDIIRKRANPAAPSSTATGIALLEEIYKERRKEMAFEDLRIFDLLRWKKGVYRADASNPNAQTLPYPNNKSIAPVPARDVLSGLMQNPSY